MYARILLIKLRDVSARESQAHGLRSWLLARGLADAFIGLPADPASERSWDLSLVLRFADEHALNQALAGDTFQQALEAQLEGNAQVLKAWSFAQLL